jgi:hypothetical protein
MAVVEIYKDKNYGGTSAKLGYGRIGDVGPDTGVPNDSISSVKVSPFTKVTFYSDRYFAGKSLAVTGPTAIPDLSTYSGDINNSVSSILIERVEPSITDKLLCCTGQKTSGCSEFNMERHYAKVLSQTIVLVI